MKPMELWESFGDLDPELLERSEEKPSRIRRLAWGASLAAACVVLSLVTIGPLFRVGSKSSAETAPAFYGPEETQPISFDAMEMKPEGLIYNDPLLCNPTYWEPLPGAITRVNLDTQTLGRISPVEHVRTGEAVYYEDGRLLRVTLEIPVAGTEAVIQLTVAEQYPMFQVDDPGEGVVSVIGDTRCLATEIPIRAPKGTGWKLGVALQSHGLNYEMFVTASPEEASIVREALTELAASIDSAEAPDLSSLSME